MSKQELPEFVLRTGPMWSSKTSSLLEDVERHRLQNKNVLLFKPSLDTRYDVIKVTTHSGKSMDAIAVQNGLDILKKIKDIDMPDMVAIDEAFMLDNVANIAIWLFQFGVSVYVSSIELSYNGKPFKEIMKMFPWATNVIKHKSICAVCKTNNAAYSYRKINDDNDIVVGGVNDYEPRCFNCHPMIEKLHLEYNNVK